MRSAYTAAGSPDVLPRLDDGVGHQQPEYESGVPLRLAAGGIVVPSDGRSPIKFLSMLRGAAARFGGGNAAPVDRPNEMDQQLEALARASAPAVPPRPTIVEERPAPIVTAPASTSVVPVNTEPTVAVAESPRRFDLTSEMVMPSDEMDGAFGWPRQRRRYSLAAAALLVIVVGGSMILLARSGRASGVRTPMKAASSAQSSTSNNPPLPAVAPVHESVDGGAVLQSVARNSSASDHPVVDSPASASKRPAPTERPSSSSSRAPDPMPAPVLPAGRLPNVKIAVAGSVGDLKLVPPELLVDERTRLTNGQDQVEQGDYAVARRTFRTAMAQLDSVAPRYPDSQAIRNLRRDIEQADARALQACTAENEMRKRRGEEVRACQ